MTLTRTIQRRLKRQKAKARAASYRNARPGLTTPRWVTDEVLNNLSNSLLFARKLR